MVRRMLQRTGLYYVLLIKTCRVHNLARDKPVRVVVFSSRIGFYHNLHLRKPGKPIGNLN